MEEISKAVAKYLNEVFDEAYIIADITRNDSFPAGEETMGHAISIHIGDRRRMIHVYDSGIAVIVPTAIDRSVFHLQEPDVLERLADRLRETCGESKSVRSDR